MGWECRLILAQARLPDNTPGALSVKYRCLVLARRRGRVQLAETPLPEVRFIRLKILPALLPLDDDSTTAGLAYSVDPNS